MSMPPPSRNQYACPRASGMHQDVAEDDGRIETESPDGLQGDFQMPGLACGRGQETSNARAGRGIPATRGPPGASARWAAGPTASTAAGVQNRSRHAFIATLHRNIIPFGAQLRSTSQSTPRLSDFPRSVQDLLQSRPQTSMKPNEPNGIRRTYGTVVLAWCKLGVAVGVLLCTVIGEAGQPSTTNGVEFGRGTCGAASGPPAHGAG